jgi:prepilin peptidase CpaA
MNPIVLWPVLALVSVAGVIDIWCRRIPNWLVGPFLIGGLFFAAASRGLAGLESSLGAIALAAVTLGGLCWLRSMGMGDLKLCAAVGAWVGFTQMGTALVITAIAGGIMSFFWALRFGRLRHSFDGASELVFGLSSRGFRPHPTLRLDYPGVRGMPYAPAILIGTLLSFFAS